MVESGGLGHDQADRQEIAALAGGPRLGLGHRGFTTYRLYPTLCGEGFLMDRGDPVVLCLSFFRSEARCGLLVRL